MGVQGHGRLCSEFEASWLYETLYQRKKKDRQTEKKSHKRKEALNKFRNREGRRSKNNLLTLWPLKYGIGN